MPWHDYLAIALFLAAAAFVARRAWKALFGPAKPGCGSGCGSCSQSASNAPSAGKLLAIGGGGPSDEIERRS